MRLTNRNGSYCDDCSDHRDYYCRCDPEIALYEKLKQYENAEEEGRLVILPCKVGDTVYTITHFCGNFVEDCNNLIPCSFCSFYKPVIRQRQLISISQIVSIMDKIGKTVFFTREKAEAALKGETNDI